MTEQVKVAICVPCHGDWKVGFAKSLAEMYGHTIWVAANERSEVGMEIGLICMGGSILPDVRTRLVAKAVEWGATHILWCDSDMVFPPDALIRLYNHGQHVVGVNYVTKDLGNARPIAYVENDDEMGPLYTRQDSTGLVSVKHTGFGLMLTTVAAFDAIDLPYFMFEPVKPQNVAFRGEDVWFCNKLRKAGVPVYVDQALSKQIGHVGNCEYQHIHAEVAEGLKNEAYEGRWGSGGVNASAKKWHEQQAEAVERLRKSAGTKEAAE